MFTGLAVTGRGPAAKLKSQRRRANDPARGEWMTLEPLEKAVLSPIGPREGGWSRATKAMWDAWRQDPASAQWSPADVAYARDTIERFERCAPSHELRLRMDGLGLTPKGQARPPLAHWERRRRAHRERRGRKEREAEVGRGHTAPRYRSPRVVEPRPGKPLFSAPSIRARRLPASAALLPQPHGFEGLSLVA
jgi:hypothetical protein